MSFISTHTLRKEGDATVRRLDVDDIIFQPTPSARRVTGRIRWGKKSYTISTHTLRKEGDLRQAVCLE